MTDVSYVVAFTSGLLSFFTPCILPLLPVYFGYLAGEAFTSFEDQKIHKKLVVNALAFAFGISVVNLLLGFGAKAVSSMLLRYSTQFRIGGGILLIAFGLYFILNLRIGFMEREAKIQYKGYSPSFLKSFLLGLTFSFAWTPCNGPIIASILFMASFKADYLSAGTLMLVYSLGFSVLFVLSAVLVGLFVGKVKKIYPYMKYVKWVAGAIMIGMGILMLTNRVNLLTF